MKRTLGAARDIFNILMLILSDLSVFVVAVLSAHLLRKGLSENTFFGTYVMQISDTLFLTLLPMGMVLMFYSFGLYTRRYDFWDEMRRVFRGLFYLFLLTSFYLFLTKTSVEYSRVVLIVLFINLFWMVPAGRVACKRMLVWLSTWHIPVYLVGSDGQKELLSANLRSNWFLGYRAIKMEKEARIVFIATKGLPLEALESMITEYKKRFAQVIVIPYLHNISFSNVDIVDLSIGRMSFINIQNQLYKTSNIVIKKALEYALILLMLPLILIVFAIVAVAIVLDSKGGVFFRQQRLGQENKPFICYKFRTMYTESEVLLKAYLKKHPEEVEHYNLYHKYQFDPRITRLGKILRRYSLDELPQILNVLRGEMNLIGPRPYMVTEYAKLESDAETILHVKPGLTGLWQVSGRNNLSFEKRRELDVWYIQNWSLWLDFIIFLKTFEVLLTRRGAR